MSKKEINFSHLILGVGVLLVLAFAIGFNTGKQSVIIPEHQYTDGQYEAAAACFESVSNDLQEVSDAVMLEGGNSTYDELQDAIFKVKLVADGGHLESTPQGSCP